MKDKNAQLELRIQLVIAAIAACCVPWGWSFVSGVGVFFLIEIAIQLTHIKSALVSKKKNPEPLDKDKASG
jgi:hypothetical protein